MGGFLILYIIMKYFWPKSPIETQKEIGGEGPGEDEVPLEGTKLVEVFESVRPSEVHVIRTLLENARIPCRVFEGGLPYGIGGGGTKVMVAVERLEEAKAILDEHIRSN
ncbi:DUF2007 domain-containing protein [candidate division TA06 bacterium]|nr:DUF2007 domain-containing protein [candidate division TA06 bacterium]